MESWIIFAILVLLAWAVLDIRERLPRSKTHAELEYHPAGDEGFQMRCKELCEGEFSVGFDGDWSTGRYFDVIGDVRPYNEDFQARQCLKFEGQQTVRFYPSTERYQRSRIGNVLQSKSGGISIYIFLPFEVHQQLRSDLKERIDQVLEIDIAENRKNTKGETTTYGVYRVEFRNHF